ncbi:uncharacterized protein LOC126767443, partial [Bactrocera neohumeralis]|uniref:uncharacterized protein LOC126767443 n=1 Tax=Bactrocera neohumeralis TaxID=98809 RepID=UPI0021657B12
MHHNHGPEKLAPNARSDFLRIESEPRKLAQGKVAPIVRFVKTSDRQRFAKYSRAQNDENRTRISQTRARECSVERSLRLAEQNKRSSQIYERESSSERSQRLAGNRDRDSRARARESSTERSQRLAGLRDRNSQARARESSGDRSQRLTAQRERQRAVAIRRRDRISAHSNRSAFSYDPQINYADQNSIQIGAMDKICPKCSAKKWRDEAIEQNERSSQIYERESSSERSQRLAGNRDRDSRARARESSTERSQRLAGLRDRNSQARARESSGDRSQRLTAQRERQRAVAIRRRDRISAHSNRSAFSYDPQINYADQNSIQIGAMDKICPKCSAKKWRDEAI